MKRHVEALVRDALSDAIATGLVGDLARLRRLPPYSVDAPAHAAHGDLACDVALVLARRLGRPPLDLAAAVLGRLRDPDGWLAEVGVAGPGFLNFRFSPRFWRTALAEALASGEAYGRPAGGRGRRARVALLHADAGAALDVDDGRAAAVADAGARLLREAGWEVELDGFAGGDRAGIAPRHPRGPLAQAIAVAAPGRRAAAAALQAARATDPAPRVVEVQPVRLLRDASPLRARPTLDELGAEIAPAAIRFHLLLERAARPLELDLGLAAHSGSDNPWFLVCLAASRLRQRAGEAAAVAAADLDALDGVDAAVLRAIAAWPDVLEQASRSVEPDRIARFAVDTAGAVHRWLNRREARARCGPTGRARAALAGALRRLLVRASALCGARLPDSG